MAVSLRAALHAVPHAVLLVTFTAITACGHQSLDTPQELDIHTYPAKTKFTLTVVMQACSDLCATYDQPSCSVSLDTTSVQTTTTTMDGTTKQIDVKKKLIRLDVHVGYTSHTSENCTGQCGPPILAHCDVGVLDPGAYTVVSGSFQADITVR